MKTMISLKDKWTNLLENGMEEEIEQWPWKTEITNKNIKNIGKILHFSEKEYRKTKEKLKNSSEQFFRDTAEKIIALDKEWYDKNKKNLDIKIKNAIKDLVVIRNKAIDENKLVYNQSWEFFYWLNADNKKSHLDELSWIITRSENFKKWFKKSKIVKWNNDPKIARHGSPRKITNFDPDAFWEWRWRNKGIHFSGKKVLTEQYAKKAIKAFKSALYEIYKHKNKCEPKTFKDYEDIANMRNEIIEDLIKYKKTSRYYKYEDDTEYINPFWKTRRWLERFLEIFGWQLPNNNNIQKIKIGENWKKILFGKDIWEYYYECFLKIIRCENVVADDIDAWFSQIETIPNTDWWVVVPKDLIKGFGGKIENSQWIENYCIFDPKNIKSTTNILFWNNDRLYW